MLKPILIALAVTVLASFSLEQIALAQTLVPLTTCVEAPASAVNVSARRKSIRSDCDPNQARNNAFLRARSNATVALSSTCIQRISAAERQATCRALGLVPAPSRNNGMAPTFVGAPGSTNIDATSAISSQLCVVLRDLPNESEATFQTDIICSFSNFRRTIFTARARARCGVQCL
jgi:hypothetical protein